MNLARRVKGLIYEIEIGRLKIQTRLANDKKVRREKMSVTYYLI